MMEMRMERRNRNIVEKEKENGNDEIGMVERRERWKEKIVRRKRNEIIERGNRRENGCKRRINDFRDEIGIKIKFKDGMGRLKVIKRLGNFRKKRLKMLLRVGKKDRRIKGMRRLKKVKEVEIRKIKIDNKRENEVGELRVEGRSKVLEIDRMKVKKCSNE